MDAVLLVVLFKVSCETLMKAPPVFRDLEALHYAWGQKGGSNGKNVISWLSVRLCLVFKSCVVRSMFITLSHTIPLHASLRLKFTPNYGKNENTSN